MFIPLHDRNPVRHIRFPYVTYGIIGLNVIVFLIQLAHGSGLSFDQFALSYAAVPAYFLQPDAPDRLAHLPDGLTLVTYAFFHDDWLHLGSNMLFLWVFRRQYRGCAGARENSLPSTSPAPRSRGWSTSSSPWAPIPG